MTTKEYLNQYRDLSRKAARLKERLLLIQGSNSVNIDGLPHGTKIGDPTKDTAIKLAEIRGKLNVALCEAALKCQIICDQIENMQTPRYKELLHSRYVLLMSWEDVTDRLSLNRRERYDSKYVMSYMHERALDEFRRVNKWEF